MRARCAWLVVSFAFACAGKQLPEAEESAGIEPTPLEEVPVHTQAMIDAYRAQTSWQTQAKVQTKQEVALACPDEENALQKQERYLRAIGGCMEGEPPAPDVALPMLSDQLAKPVRDALDTRKAAIDACVDQAERVWGPSQSELVQRIELDEEGHIRAIRPLSDPANTADIGCCVRRELMQAALPKLGRAVSLIYTVPLQRDTTGHGLTKELLRANIRKHDDDVRACYEAGMQGRTFEGRVAVRFVIASDGTVPLSALRESDLPSREAACCIARKVRGWQFPRPANGVSAVVDYPFVLKLAK